MSVAKWAYDPDMCNDQICPGDCEFCRIWLDREDEEADDEYEDEFQQERNEVGLYERVLPGKPGPIKRR